jgi:hypothetical protein
MYLDHSGNMMSDKDRISDLERKLDLLEHRMYQVESWNDFFSDEQKRYATHTHSLIAVVAFLSICFVKSLMYTTIPGIFIITMAVCMAPLFYRILSSL